MPCDSVVSIRNIEDKFQANTSAKGAVFVGMVLDNLLFVWHYDSCQSYAILLPAW